VSFSKGEGGGGGGGGEEEEEENGEENGGECEGEYEEEEEEEEGDVQFGAIAIGRRRSSRSFSGTASKLSKSFSAQQSVSKRRQMNVNQLCVGKWGSLGGMGGLLVELQKIGWEIVRVYFFVRVRLFFFFVIFF